MFLKMLFVCTMVVTQFSAAAEKDDVTTGEFTLSNGSALIGNRIDERTVGVVGWVLSCYKGEFQLLVSAISPIQGNVVEMKLDIKGVGQKFIAGDSTYIVRSVDDDCLLTIEWTGSM